jgi:tetrahydromethanopterin S-methyltransferase subunit D
VLIQFFTRSAEPILGGRQAGGSQAASLCLGTTRAPWAAGATGLTTAAQLTKPYKLQLTTYNLQLTKAHKWRSTGL